ncbi:hypothetical protein F2P81_003302 [Scophthalmus maximus]|uniref:Uncharacterized protein n=1 Tax=Scophthalmus maximus TaxID=52904 RepID=A0A6A4TLR0_SCOMX|nr:hypothetical protein F2P81_003302 [Scophthalmus maximus]
MQTVMSDCSCDVFSVLFGMHGVNDARLKSDQQDGSGHQFPCKRVSAQSVGKVEIGDTVVKGAGNENKLVPRYTDEREHPNSTSYLRYGIMAVLPLAANVTLARGSGESLAHSTWCCSPKPRQLRSDSQTYAGFVRGNNDTQITIDLS